MGAGTAGDTRSLNGEESNELKDNEVESEPLAAAASSPAALRRCLAQTLQQRSKSTSCIIDRRKGHVGSDEIRGGGSERGERLAKEEVAR